MNVQVFDERRCVLGEGPVWHAATGRVVWLDILSCLIRWRSLEGEVGEVTMPRHIGALLPAADGTWLAFLVDGVYRLTADFGSPRLLIEFPHRLPPVAGEPQIRANDAKVAPDGRVFCGTMPYDWQGQPGAAALYLLDPTGLQLVDQATISNGLGWSPDGTAMYYIDTPLGGVDVFDVAPTGEVSGRRPLLRLPTGSGYPDGMTVDSAGGLWVAVWEGSRVQRYTPDGQPAGQIELPAARVTSCAFIGPELRHLVITTASIEDDNPAAGLTYLTEVDVPGQPQPLALL